ncbi:MAG TPA: LLM class flavin-dependent oxidoreductase [Candidatus Nesterenkonia stercoripullorum]|uniref:LLM class flavin-dependent oxidoreductase n=1 Tax=Candidatus Nesterenkonia stercoripullorum TaxID=2838701 RepID=A0A9D1URJ9_9MICC|nr:LLM class flavin-dependent oxidoreductase [Candidatus Nesterenkonia stercoripullorum]
MAPRIGFFTRLLEDSGPAERYRFALEQIRHAERHGFATAWVAQHHFNAAEGGLPSPWPLLGAAAATTSRIRLGTAVVTLPHENPLRVAEDAAVVDQLSGGRLELGVAPGASPQALEAFGYAGQDPKDLFAEKLPVLRSALRGEPQGESGLTLQPLGVQASGVGAPIRALDDRLWQATFSDRGATRAALAGDGLMLSRIQPGDVDVSLNASQRPIVEAYLENLPEHVEPRILSSRTLVVVDEENRQRVAATARERVAALAAKNYGVDPSGYSDRELLRITNSYFGTPEEVAEQLSRDEAAARSSDVSFQAHSIDPGHELTLRSIELIATAVAPQLGWELAP